jgi:hypothetical protein
MVCQYHYKDIADMWIHESFTNYSESLLWNIIMEAGFEYVRNQENIQNDKPIIGHYNVNNEGSSDMYHKKHMLWYFGQNCKHDENGELY